MNEINTASDVDPTEKGLTITLKRW